MITNRLLRITLLAVAAVSVAAERTAGGLLQEPLPTGREVIARHVSAIGGAEALRSVHSIHARGRFAIPAQGIEGDLELLSARPARLLYRVDVPGLGLIEHGYDGAVGWLLSPAAGPELLVGRQLSETADDAWFESTLHGPEYVRDVTTVGRTEFDGRAAFEVRVVLASGHEQTEYFDVEAGWQIGSQAERATPQGVINTVNMLRGYRQFGPLMQATTFVQRALGFEQVLTVTSYEYDVVPADAFERPAEVSALVQE